MQTSDYYIGSSLTLSGIKGHIETPVIIYNGVWNISISGNQRITITKGRDKWYLMIINDILIQQIEEVVYIIT